MKKSLEYSKEVNSMYILTKPRGHNSLITIDNQDTNSSVVVGRITMEILDILKTEEGKDTTGDDFKLTDDWSFEIKDETARKISATTMKMKKPIRTKTETPKSNKEIDAMDVLLGLASYN